MACKHCPKKPKPTQNQPIMSGKIYRCKNKVSGVIFELTETALQNLMKKPAKAKITEILEEVEPKNSKRYGHQVKDTKTEPGRKEQVKPAEKEEKPEPIKKEDSKKDDSRIGFPEPPETKSEEKPEEKKCPICGTVITDKRKIYCKPECKKIAARIRAEKADSKK